MNLRPNLFHLSQKALVANVTLGILLFGAAAQIVFSRALQASDNALPATLPSKILIPPSAPAYIPSSEELEKRAAEIAAFHKKFPHATLSTLQYLNNFSLKMGVPSSLSLPLIISESGGDKNSKCGLPGSTAAGYFQFIIPTWPEYLGAIRDDTTGLREKAFEIDPKLKELVGYVEKGKNGKYVIKQGRISVRTTSGKTKFIDIATFVNDARKDPTTNITTGLFSMRLTIDFWNKKFGRNPLPEEVWLANIVNRDRAAILVEEAGKSKQKPLNKITYGKKGRPVFGPDEIANNWLLRGARNAKEVLVLARNMTDLVETGCLLVMDAPRETPAVPKANRPRKGPIAMMSYLGGGNVWRYES